VALPGPGSTSHGKQRRGSKGFRKGGDDRLNDLITISPLPLLKNPAPGSEGVKPRDRYQVAFESVEQYLAVTQNPTEDWLVTLEALRFYRDYYAGARSDETIVTTKERTPDFASE